jgi:hypothetical protein
MKKTNVTFEELRQLLLDLGFDVLEDTRYEHPVTKTVLLFRPHAPKEHVTDRDMLVVRRQLVDNGLIQSSAFDRFLHEVTA